MAPDNIALMYETAARDFLARNSIVSKWSVASLQRGGGGGHDLFLTYRAPHPRFRDALLGLRVGSSLQWFKAELLTHASGVYEKETTLRFFF